MEGVIASSDGTRALVAYEGCQEALLWCLVTGRHLLVLRPQMHARTEWECCTFFADNTRAVTGVGLTVTVWALNGEEGERFSASYWADGLGTPEAGCMRVVRMLPDVPQKASFDMATYLHGGDPFSWTEEGEEVGICRANIEQCWFDATEGTLRVVTRKAIEYSDRPRGGYAYRLWSVGDDGARTSILIGNGLSSCAVFANGTRAVTVSSNKPAQVLDLTTGGGTCLMTLAGVFAETVGKPVKPVTVSADGATAVTSTRVISSTTHHCCSRIRFWDIREKGPSCLLREASGR